MRHSPWIRRSVVSFVALFSAGRAYADGVPPPPADCPPGAVGETGHNGPYCRPQSCTTDAECNARRGRDTRPRTCVPLAICVEERKESSASGWSHGTPITRRLAHEACDDDGACEVGSCERGNHCVLTADSPPERPATAKAPADGAAKACGGCDAGGADAALGSALAAALVAAWRHRRHFRSE